MEAGLPVVINKVGGVRDFVTSGVNGILVPSEEPDALAEALAKMINDSELRLMMGQESRKIAVKFFTFVDLFNAFESTYRRLDNKKSEVNYDTNISFN